MTEFKEDPEEVAKKKELDAWRKASLNEVSKETPTIYYDWLTLYVFSAESFSKGKVVNKSQFL